MGLRASIAAAGMLLGSLPQGAAAAELVILTNQGATPGVRELATAFSQASGHKVTVIQEAGAALERRLNSPAPGDLLTGNPGPFDDLIKKGKVVPGTVTPFVLAGLGVSVRAGAPKPDIGTVDALRRALLAASTVAYADGGASGVQFHGILARLGLAEAMKGKLRPYPTGGAIEAVARGEADLVVIGISPILYVPAVTLVGWLPDELQSYIFYTGSIGATTKQPLAAQTLLKLLTSPPAVDLFKSHGFEPAPR